MLHGRGKMVWKAQPGDRYENYYDGDWIQDAMTGHGWYQRLSGHAYVGQFLNNKFHGHGTMVFKAQLGDEFEHYYDGEWLDNMMTGHGQSQYRTGEFYVGQFFENMHHGRGKIEYKAEEGDQSEHYYEGEWHLGKKHGKGKLQLGDGTIKEGQFVDGELIEDDQELAKDK